MGCNRRSCSRNDSVPVKQTDRLNGRGESPDRLVISIPDSHLKNNMYITIAIITAAVAAILADRAWVRRHKEDKDE